jgi:uncharacterized protein
MQQEKDQAIAPVADSTLFDRLGITSTQLAEFCQRWKVTKLSLFGSILRDDFRPDSDIDLLVTFVPNHTWGLEFVQMREELEFLLGRSVDLLTHQSILRSRNPLRSQEILNSAKVVYEAR